MSSAGARPFREDDFDAVTDLWHRAKRAAYPFLPLEQSRTLAEDRAFFRGTILAECRVWIAAEDGVPRAYLAMKGSLVDRLYVDPDHQGRGLGSLLLRVASRESPRGLTLYTHQENAAARRFYERRGFRAVAFGTSPPPESAPDVLYEWKPR